MPRRYRANADDVYVFTFLLGVYGALKPIEEKLRAGGYIGPILPDFDNNIYSKYEIIDEEATRKKQEAADKKKGGSAPKVSPEFKKSDISFSKVDFEDSYESDFRFESNISGVTLLSKKGEKDFREYIKKLEDYMDLLIKNTPKEEYADELKAVEFFEANLRIIKVFGSRAFLYDRMGFLVNTRGYDADVSYISDKKGLSHSVSRELWKNVDRYYPYGDIRNAVTSLLNTACDYEEDKNKDNYISQIEYRERYKECIMNYYSAMKGVENGPEEFDRLLRVAIRDDVIKEYKDRDAKDKKGIYVDYEAIYIRVEQQIKNGQESSKDDLDIYNRIKERVDKIVSTERVKKDLYNSKYFHELNSMEYWTNEKDFTGFRGNMQLYDEVEVQLNAIDMGWPLDEIPHVQRIFKMTKPGMGSNSYAYGEKEKAIISKARTFYNERIKDKPYPSKDSERKAFYRDFYQISKEMSDIIAVCVDLEDGSLTWHKWSTFAKDIKESMNKPLSFADKIVINHIQKDPEVTFEDIASIKTSIETTRFGHKNSQEYNNLVNAYNDFNNLAVTIDGTEAFKVNSNKLMNSYNLDVLKDLREAAKVYLKSKDKDKKMPNDRSTLGQKRYEGAMKAYHLADKLIKLNEAEIKRRADIKREAEQEKGRKETMEAFGDKENVKLVTYNTYKAGGKEQYNALLAEEAKKEADALKKEPVTDEEKYERFINSCRTKKEDPISLDDDNLNNELQNKRVDDLAKMLAAIEFQEAGKEFNDKLIEEKADEIKTIYSLAALKISTENLNGPERLKNALSFTFRAVDTKRELEMSLYEVGKVNCKNTYFSQKNYQKDIAEILERPDTGEIGLAANGIESALREIVKINTEDGTLVGINSYNFRKANVKLANEIKSYFDKCNVIDVTEPDTKFAFDCLAVLDTYTGCKPVTNRLLQSIDDKVMLSIGRKNNINLESFNTDYGVDHSKEVVRLLKRPADKVVAGDVVGKKVKMGGLGI